MIKEENSIVSELEKRYIYINEFFESLSDEEFVQIMIECGIEKSKKLEESDYIKAFYPDIQQLNFSYKNVPLLKNDIY